MAETPRKSHGRLAVRASQKPRVLMDEPPPVAKAWHVTVLTLFPGLFPGPLAESLTGAALQRGVWRVDAPTGQLTFVPVTVDHYTEGDAFVRSDQLATGDNIVTTGVHKLDKGLTVRLAGATTEDVR